MRTSILINKSNISYFNNCSYLEFPGGENKETLIVFFHGFPADSGKNEDIAEKLSELEGYSTVVFEYSGLGSSRGHFSFTNSIIESQAFLEYLSKSKRIKKLVVVGHSWGGLVAINLIERVKEISEAILLAPFVHLPDEDAARAILLDFIANEKEVRRKEYRIEDLMRDFFSIREDFSPLKKLGAISERGVRLTIVQGDNDDVCPPDGALLLQSGLGEQSKLITIPAGHWFENRNELFQVIRSSLAE